MVNNFLQSFNPNMAQQAQSQQNQQNQPAMQNNGYQPQMGMNMMQPRVGQNFQPWMGPGQTQGGYQPWQGMGQGSPQTPMQGQPTIQTWHPMQGQNQPWHPMQQQNQNQGQGGQWGVQPQNQNLEGQALSSGNPQTVSNFMTALQGVGAGTNNSFMNNTPYNNNMPNQGNIMHGFNQNINSGTPGASNPNIAQAGVSQAPGIGKAPAPNNPSINTNQQINNGPTAMSDKRAKTNIAPGNPKLLKRNKGTLI
jgi:hypothetical protein